MNIYDYIPELFFEIDETKALASAEVIPVRVVIQDESIPNS